MTSIHQIFDADATELHDLRADPNTIIKIQGLVKEMIEANDNRQLGISREIVEEYGTFALPGIISATYVLGDQLNNKKRRSMVGQLMAELCRDNVPAQRLLLRSGIIENPFEVSRKIAVDVLNNIDGLQMSPEDIEWLVGEVMQLVRDEERNAVLVIFGLLLHRGVAYEAALDVCYRWFASDYEADAPVELMRILLKTFPEQTENTLNKLFDALERRDDEAGRNIKGQVDLGAPDAMIPAIRASSKRLDRERTGRAKPVEFLFEGAIARQIIASPDYIPVCEKYVRSERLNESISRYWWQALSSAVKMKSEDAKRYFETSLLSIDDEEFAVWGFVQLMFLETDRDKQTKAWASQTIHDLGMQNPHLHRAAEDIKERITSGVSTSGKSRRQIGNTNIN